MLTTTERPPIEAGFDAFTGDDWWVILQAVANETRRLEKSIARLERGEAHAAAQTRHAHLESLMMRLYATAFRAYHPARDSRQARPDVAGPLE